jgi:hypothetical protein
MPKLEFITCEGCYFLGPSGCDNCTSHLWQTTRDRNSRGCGAYSADGHVGPPFVDIYRKSAGEGEETK